MLEASFHARCGTFALDFTVGVSRGQTLAVVGASGAGKTTALRCVAGLKPIRSGYVRFDGLAWSDREARLHTPTHERDLAFVFTKPALFAQMSALENAAFGLEALGVPRPAAMQRAREALAIVEAEPLAQRRARGLSSGEAQRVALARAIALRPAVLLLDEPLASLDARLRPLVRDALRRTIEVTGAATLLVTHEPEEARAFTDDFVVVEDGRIVQRGRARHLIAAPATEYVRTIAARMQP